MSHNFKRNRDIIQALLFRGQQQQYLFRYAREVRDRLFSGRVEVRSVVEYSNMCLQACNYCGLATYSNIKRYILNEREVLKRIERLYGVGRRVIMFQAGEFHSAIYFNRLYRLLRQIKELYRDLTLICSFGSLSEDKYKKLKNIGIDRYLLKFETSDPRLYKTVKPSDTLNNRLNHIKILKKLGFQVSSGNITGLPGQSLSSLAEDLLLLKKLDIPMCSTSPFIPNDISKYAHYSAADINLVLNFTAILRIMCPAALIPATSALELISKNGQYLGLMAGANVLTLHDGTPENKEKNYVIYKQNRYKPKDSLFDFAKKANLRCSNVSLIRDKIENNLFYKLVNKNVDKNKIAVYCEDGKYTYNDLLRISLKFCSFLQNNGIKEGQIALLTLYDSIEFIVAFLSCIRLGVIVAPVDPQVNKDEWNLIISQLSCDVILATEDICKKFKDKRILRIANDNSSDYFFSIIKRQSETNSYVSADRNNPALILHTSGTTGNPKGVVHTYKNLFLDNFPRLILKMSKEDTVFSYSRIYTSFGLGNSFLFPLHSGGSVILSRTIPNPFSLKRILKLKPTLFFAVPSIYELLLDYVDTLKSSFQSIRLFISSGERLYSDIFKRWISAFQAKILECYGTTEMCHSFISNIPGKEKQGSCGKPVDGFEVKFNKSGHMFYRGPSLMPRYYNERNLTQEKVIDGWFKSDDIGYMDKEGYVFLKGRNNLITKSSGKWVSLLDLENRLRQYNLVKEIAIIKKRRGLDYYVSLNKNSNATDAETKIRRYCMKNIKLNEFPRRIYIINKMPKTRSGKIDRKFLEADDNCI